MSLNREKLLRMAQQIAANLDYGDDPDVTASAVASHLERFWEPRMRETLLAYHLENPDAFSPLLQQTLVRLTPTPA